MKISVMQYFSFQSVASDNKYIYGGKCREKHIADEKNGLDHTLVNGVYLPNQIATETSYVIGQWGLRHLT